MPEATWYASKVMYDTRGDAAFTWFLFSRYLLSEVSSHACARIHMEGSCVYEPPGQLKSQSGVSINCQTWE